MNARASRAFLLTLAYCAATGLPIAEECWAAEPPVTAHRPPMPVPKTGDG